MTASRLFWGFILSFILTSTSIFGQKSHNGWGLGLGVGPRNPFDISLSLRRYFSDALFMESYLHFSVHAFSLKPYVEKYLGEKLGIPQFAIGRENGWLNDWYLSIGYGQYRFLSPRRKKIRLFLDLTALFTYEQYRAKNQWIQHQGKFIAYSNALYSVYHTSLSISPGCKISLNQSLAFFLTPFAFRADIGLVTVPSVTSPKAMRDTPSSGLDLIANASKIDRQTGLISGISFFDGPLLLIRITF